MNERRVIEGLLHDDLDLLGLYHSNAYFKFGIDSLVRGFLPTFLRGLADESREKNEQMQADIKRLSRGV